MKTKKTIFITTMITCLIITSCGTVFGSSSVITIDGDIDEPVTITTAKKTYPYVKLPYIVEIKRHHIDGQRIKIESDNHKYHDIVLDKTLNGWTFGNIVLGGIPGWIIDLCTNGVCKPSQKHYYIQEKK